jgi:lipoate synthase
MSCLNSYGLTFHPITKKQNFFFCILPDQGSGHFAETVQKLKALKPEMLIEALGKRRQTCSSLSGVCLVTLACQHGVDHIVPVKLVR